MNAIRNVASLIFALGLLQLSQGALNVHLPLAMAAEHFSETEIGLVGAAYSAGFMAGAWLGPPYLARIGNTRLFAAGAAIAATSTLAIYWSHGAVPWMLCRFGTGVAVALMLAAGESWMNSVIAPGERGSVIGFNQVCYKAVLALGPFLTIGHGAAAPDPWMISALITVTAVLPICFTSRAQPAPPTAKPLGVNELFAIAPAAVFGCFLAGLTNAAVTTMAPIYSEDRFGPSTAATFVAAAWIGSLIVQWPAGKLSDHMDRRIVCAGLLALAAFGSSLLIVFDQRLPFAAACFVFAIWGAGSLSYYGVAFAHMADRAEPSKIPGATAGLLFAWAVGSVIGPAVLGAIVDATNPVAIFWYGAGIGVGGVLLMLVRRGARPAPAHKADYVDVPTTSVSTVEIAYEPEAGEKRPNG
ncbi:MAG: MFS transporter [Hyphomonadaceae bacterium]